MKKSLALVCGLLFGASALANSPVYTISKDDHTLYLGGTMHLLSKKDFPLPAVFEAAYQNADTTAFEADTSQMESPEFQMLMMQKMTYQDGNTIQSVIQPDTFAKLEEHVGKRGIPVANILSFKPGMVSIFLTIIELQMQGIGQQGVDQFYFDKSKEDGKSMVFLETPEQQLSFLAEMGIGNEDHFIQYSLQDVQELPEQMSLITSSWRSGDFEKLDQEILTEMREQFPNVYRSLLVTRNNAWMPVIEKMLDDKPVEFVMVGALHLAGEHGLLNQLKSKGYSVEEFHVE